jgi:hypothetical protein
MTEEHEVRVSAWIDYPFDQTARPVSFTALQVSNDCDHGATVMVSDRSVLRVENVIKGAVSGSVLVEVTPRRTGRATVTLVQSGAAPSTVTFIVRRLF